MICFLHWHIPYGAVWQEIKAFAPGPHFQVPSVKQWYEREEARATFAELLFAKASFGAVVSGSQKVAANNGCASFNNHNGTRLDHGKLQAHQRVCPQQCDRANRNTTYGA